MKLTTLHRCLRLDPGKMYTLVPGRYAATRCPGCDLLCAIRTRVIRCLGCRFAGRIELAELQNGSPRVVSMRQLEQSTRVGGSA